MLKLVYMTDTHGRANNPASRKDNFPETILNKIRWVINYAKNEDADAIVHGGDWVNSPDTTPAFIRKLAEILSSFGKPIYTVIGNHDEYGQNPQTFEKTPLSILEAAGMITRLSVDNPIIIEDSSKTTRIQLTGVDANYDLDKEGRVSDYIEVPSTVSCNKIHVVHGFLTDRIWPQVPCTLIDSILSTKADIILSGHEHGGFGVIQRNGKIFCNPGALARVSASIGDVNQEVKVAVIIAEGPAADVQLERLPASVVKPASEVIDRDKLIEEKMHQDHLNNFINDINNLKVGQTFNIYHVLEEIAKQENLSADIVELTRLNLQKAEEQLKQE
jgi:DNA repair exonuclease SbcCD nuclease subunit